MSLVEDLFTIVAPHECLGCKAEGSLLCRACAANLPTVPPRCYGCQRLEDAYRTCQRCRRRSPLSSVLAVTAYDGLAKELLRRLKFGRAKAAGQVLAEALAPLCAPLPGPELLITHIPTANSRVRARGYDQAEIIAKALARQLRVPYAPLLARTGRQRQVGHDRAARQRQMQQAFRVLRAPILSAKHILVVDDVLTTGATCEAAARVLRQAGARRVHAAVFAVADRTLTTGVKLV